MPDKKTAERARQDLREGKKPSTAAGEFVKEEIDHVRSGKHGARSPRQAIAIGLNQARRAGIPLKPPRQGKTSSSTRRSAERAYARGQSGARSKANKTSARASGTRERVMQREPKDTASHQALSRHAKQAAAERRKSGAKGRAASSRSGSARARDQRIGRSAKPPGSRTARSPARDRAADRKIGGTAGAGAKRRPAPRSRQTPRMAKSGLRHQ